MLLIVYDSPDACFSLLCSPSSHLLTLLPSCAAGFRKYLKVNLYDHHQKDNSVTLTAKQRFNAVNTITISCF